MNPLATTILTIAYQRLGINIKVLELPGARADLLLRYGEIDGVLFRGLHYESYLANVIRIPVVIAQGEIRAFATQTNIKINDWPSLIGYQIGGLIRIKSIVPKELPLQVNYIKTPELLFKMLSRQRIDIAVAPRVMGQFFITQLGMNNIFMLDPPVQRDRLYHYVDAKHAHLVPALTTTLQQMHDSGEIASLTQQATSKMLKRMQIMSIQARPLNNFQDK